MDEFYYDDFNQYLKEKNIILVDEFHSDDHEKYYSVLENDIEEHFKVLNEFHKLTIGFNGMLGRRLNNYTGKKLEDCKVSIKKLKRDLKKYKTEKPSNYFEEKLVTYGDEMLNRSEYCIQKIFEFDYYELINRSMKRTEICLGNSYIDNIRKNTNIEIINLEHCGYNLLECDGLYYLNKLKRKEAKVDWRGVVKKYCEIEELNPSSEMYMLAMLSFPYEFMKCCNRYRYKTKEWSDERYGSSLELAIKKDGDSII